MSTSKRIEFWARNEKPKELEHLKVVLEAEKFDFEDEGEYVGVTMTCPYSFDFKRILAANKVKGNFRVLVWDLEQEPDEEYTWGEEE